MWENEGSGAPEAIYSRSVAPSLLQTHVCTTSVVVEFIYAGFILTSFLYVDAELIGREG
jgi:hypothetical protein